MKTKGKRALTAVFCVLFTAFVFTPGILASDAALNEGGRFSADSDRVCLAVSVFTLVTSSLLCGAAAVLYALRESKGDEKMGQKLLKKKEIEALREEFPAGTRVSVERIVKSDPKHAVYFGQRGTVKAVDSYGNLHVVWDNSAKGLLDPELDSFHKEGGK